MIFPEAAAGHFVRVEQDLAVYFQGRDLEYADLSLEDLAQQYYKCTPFEACLGSCTDEQLETDDDGFDYAACDGASGQMSCSIEYQGDRCSECTPFDPDLPDCDTSATDVPPNGYYRLDQVCVPCTCSWFTFERICMIAFVVTLVIMVVVDHFLKEVDHMSTIFAPLMIAVTFFQTLGLLLDLDVSWPPALRRWMSTFNVLNINLQLAKPECSINFGATEKLYVTLMLPVAVAVLLGVYAVVQYGLSMRMTPRQFRAKHSGRDVFGHLWRQLLTATVASFIFGSIFFLRNVLVTWDCTTAADGERRFLKAEPVIECSDNDDEYIALYYMSVTGLLVYLCMFGSFAFGLTVKRDLFDFLGDKFEDAFFFWELVLLSRKVLIMMSFMFFADLAEQAWFLGSAVMVVSLLLHSATKPYEDELIDWCEFLSLLSTLFIFQAGVVFKVVNDPSNPATTKAAHNLSAALEWVSMALTIVNVFLTVFVEIRVWKHVRDGEEDYRVRMLKRQRSNLEKELEDFAAGIVKAKAMADERAAHRAAIHGHDDDDENEFGNPVSDELDKMEMFDNPIIMDEEVLETGDAGGEKKEKKKDKKKKEKEKERKKKKADAFDNPVAAGDDDQGGRSRSGSPLSFEDEGLRAENSKDDTGTQ